MSTAAVAVIVIVAVLVIAALGFLAWRQQQRRRLRERRAEYDRAVERHKQHPRRRAGAPRPRAASPRTPDPPSTRRTRPVPRRLAAGAGALRGFPRSAVAEADNLLIRVMKDRGYPTEDYEQQVADLSVEHGGTIDRYRTAHDIRGRAGDAGQATTEDLRQAMVHYRALFADLLGDGESHVDRESAEDGRATASGQHAAGPRRPQGPKGPRKPRGPRRRRCGRRGPARVDAGRPPRGVPAGHRGRGGTDTMSERQDRPDGRHSLPGDRPVAGVLPPTTPSRAASSAPPENGPAGPATPRQDRRRGPPSHRRPAR